MIKKKFIEFRLKVTKSDDPDQGAVINTFLRYISLFISFLLTRTPISANSVTLLGILSSILSCYFFYNLELGVAVLFILIAVITDYIDGDVARYRNSMSKTGSYLDIVHHIVVQGLILFGLVVYLFKKNYINNVLFFIVPLASITYPIINQFAIDSALLKHVTRKTSQSSNTTEHKNIDKKNYLINFFIKKILRYIDFPYVVLIPLLIVPIPDKVLENNVLFIEYFLIALIMIYIITEIMIVLRIIVYNKIETKFNEIKNEQ